MALPAYDETYANLTIAELEEKLVDNRQRADCLACRGPWISPTGFELQVAADVPFAQIWRVMVTGARAGYSQVRFTVGDADDQDPHRNDQ